MDDINNKQIPRPYMLENFEKIERLEKYLHLAHKRIFPKGAIVQAQGKNANSILYVKSGCLGVSIGSDDGCTKFLFHVNEKTIGATINSNEDNSEVQVYAIRKSTVYFLRLKIFWKYLMRINRYFWKLFKIFLISLIVLWQKQGI